MKMMLTWSHQLSSPFSDLVLTKMKPLLFSSELLFESSVVDDGALSDLLSAVLAGAWFSEALQSRLTQTLFSVFDQYPYK